MVIALLDWGMGHTTRSIPIIKHLLELNYYVIVACNSTQKALLLEEFPKIEYVFLNGYGLNYASSGWRTQLKLIFQIPKILIKINQEHQWLSRYVKQMKVNLLISDNRFGFYSSEIRSIFITHQLGIKSGFGLVVDRILRSFNYRYINRYSICWVPDFEGQSNLAGELSHPEKLPATPLHYLGCLSRIEPCEALKKELSFIIIILSGPEPQRTLLEKKILMDAASLSSHLVLVRGLPGNSEQLNAPSHITVFNHLSATLLNKYLCSASYVISRSGYTSIMDYAKIGVRSILIPTPGQAEQEYLGKYLLQQKFALVILQKDFELKEAIQKANAFPYKKTIFQMENYKSTIEDSLKSFGC